MKKCWSCPIIAGLLALILASCSQFFEAGGSRISLDADVIFVRPDLSPVAGVPVYVIETIGTTHPVTEVLRTDALGHVRLQGDYCLPVIVATQGGSVVIQRHSIVPAYRVTIKMVGQPPLDQLAGKPDAEFIRRSRIHIDCG
jgi:hypothetical protein